MDIVTKPIPTESVAPRPVPFARFLGAPDQFVVAVIGKDTDGSWVAYCYGPCAVSLPPANVRTFADCFRTIVSHERTEALTHEPRNTVAVIVRDAAGDCELRTETHFACWPDGRWERLDSFGSGLNWDWKTAQEVSATPPPSTPSHRLQADAAASTASPGLGCGCPVRHDLDDAASKAASVNEAATDPLRARLEAVSRQWILRTTDEWLVGSGRKVSLNLSVHINGQSLSVDGTRLDELVALAEAWSMAFKPSAGREERGE